MVTREFKYQIFKNRGGISEVRNTPVYFRKFSLLSFYAICKIRISLPKDQQMSWGQPVLVRRLNRDFGPLLSSLSCSTGDFGKALNEGRVSLGHIWAEIYSICLDQVSLALGFGHIRFDERFKIEKEGEGFIDWKIYLFFSEPFPEEFVGLENLITGYLNAAIGNKPFPIGQRLQDFIDYRSIFETVKPSFWQVCLRKFCDFLCGRRN